MHRFTVTELTQAVAEVVGGTFPSIAVEGELSGFKPHSSGHWYFSLKDGGAVVSCAMFRGDNQRVRQRPRDGDRVVLYGGLSVYPPRGTYSLIVRRMEPVGAGDLARKLEELRAKLAAEGLFDPARKRPLPTVPATIGVATSATGAALRDILRVARQRFPAVSVVVAPCLVQGDGAARDIARALDVLAADGRSEVIVVGRGGGSVEDLWAFNEEAVVRAVARMPVPVVSAVGHEVDVTLCDLVADVRAATPSHAAELVVPVADALALAVEDRADRLHLAMQRRIDLARERVRRLRLVHPGEKVARGRLRTDELDTRLHDATARLVGGQRDRLAAATRQLHALSPLAVLVRGYAIADRDGAVVRDAASLAVGDHLRLRFGAGEADAVVEAVRAGPVAPGGSAVADGPP